MLSEAFFNQKKSYIEKFVCLFSHYSGSEESDSGTRAQMPHGILDLLVNSGLPLAAVLKSADVHRFHVKSTMLCACSQSRQAPTVSVCI